MLTTALPGKEKIHIIACISCFLVYCQNYNMSSLRMRTHVFQDFFLPTCLFHSENELCILCKMSYAADLHRPHKYLTLGKKKQTLNILMRPFQSSMYWSEFKWIKHPLCFASLLQLSCVFEILPLYLKKI